MADTEEKIEEKNEETEVESTEEAKPAGSKKLIIIIAGIVALLLIVAGTLFFTPLGNNLFGKGEDETSHDEEKQEIDITKVDFVTLPEILINLRSADGRSSFLKTTFILEAPNEEVSKKIDKLKPLLIDQIQIYLRELEVEDLRGSAGMQRIRQELINRTNALLNPEKINNVLFKEFLVQ